MFDKKRKDIIIAINKKLKKSGNKEDIGYISVRWLEIGVNQGYKITDVMKAIKSEIKMQLDWYWRALP